MIYVSNQLISRGMTSRLLIAILIFYRKLVVPSLVTALLVGFVQYGGAGGYPWSLVAISYLLMSLVFHLFIYEIRNPGEYYFYHNLGLSKLYLWGATLLLSTLLAILILIACP